MSLYRNKFNKKISDAAFGDERYKEIKLSISPEFTTDGTFAKCWIREDGKIKLVKAGMDFARNTGLEPYSEYYAGDVLEAFGVKHIKYELGTHRGKLVSKCELFTSEDYGYIAYGAIGDTKSIEAVSDYYDRMGMTDVLRNMLIADALIFNTDRHMGNFGFIFDTRNGKIVGAAPLFDHNLSMLCHAEKEDFKNTDVYLKRLGHSLIGGDFIENIKWLVNDDVRKRLRRMRGFKFTSKNSRFKLPEWRLRALEKVIDKQIVKLLEN